MKEVIGFGVWLKDCGTNAHINHSHLYMKRIKLWKPKGNIFIWKEQYQNKCRYITGCCQDLQNFFQSLVSLDF